MSLTDAELESDLGEIIADYPQSITFSGAAYACIAETLTEGKEGLEEAGYMAADGVAIHVQASLFSTRPVAGNTLTYRSRTLRVTNVGTTADNLEVILNCEEETA